jgi:hypothetical protein
LVRARAPDGHEHLIGLHWLRLPFGLDLDGHAVAARFHRLHLDARANGDASAGKEPRDLRRCLLVLDEEARAAAPPARSPDAVRGVHVGELHADGASADDDQASRAWPSLRTAPLEEITRFSSNAIARQRLGLGAGPEDDGLGFESCAHPLSPSLDHAAPASVRCPARG